MDQQTPKAAKNWTAGQLKFIEWLALPKIERRPKTQGLFAKELGVHETTLSDWKRIDGFQEEVTARARFYLKGEIPAIFDSLVKQAKDGNVNAIKLALEVAGEYTPKQDITSGGLPMKGYAVVSPDDWDTP